MTATRRASRRMNAHAATANAGSAATGPIGRLWHRITEAPIEPGDSPELRRQKRQLFLTTLLKAGACPIRYGTYFAVGAPAAALAPLVYQALTLVSIAHFFRARRIDGFRLRAELLILALPVGMHVALGGFAKSSAVVLWSFLAPVLSVLFPGPRQAGRWIAVFGAILVVLGLVDPLLAPLGPTLSPAIQSRSSS